MAAVAMPATPSIIEVKPIGMIMEVVAVGTSEEACFTRVQHVFVSALL
jgi:hypothetical protein